MTSAREPTVAAIPKEGRPVVFCHSQLRCPSSHFWIIDAALPPPALSPRTVSSPRETATSGRTPRAARQPAGDQGLKTTPVPEWTECLEVASPNAPPTSRRGLLSGLVWGGSSAVGTTVRYGYGNAHGAEKPLTSCVAFLLAGRRTRRYAVAPEVGIARSKACPSIDAQRLG